MTSLIRTNSDNQDFVALIQELDAELAVRDGQDHSFYNQFNKIDAIRHVIVAYDGDTPVACGAIKEFSEDAMEVKRMYTTPHSRGKGIGGIVLTELEKWAGELAYKKCVLETGKKQPEAIALYKRQGFNVTQNYGQYAGVENSVCFEKVILK